jgi:membrane-associated protease RseP (regulator of RpoE activity)
MLRLRHFSALRLPIASGIAIVAALGGGPVGRCRSEDSPPAFEAGDISIGEPIALPFAAPRTSAPPHAPAAVHEPAEVRASALDGSDGSAFPAAPAARLAPIHDPLPPTGSRPQPEAGTERLSNIRPQAAPTALAQGWLGLAVGESSIPGRWVVDTVAAVGPAAAAGILPGDEVRAINGLPLRNADDVSQALTAITPGQVVGMAVARGEQVRDVQLTAAARPPVAAIPPTPGLGSSVVRDGCGRTSPDDAPIRH